MDKIKNTLKYINNINVCELKSYDEIYKKLLELESNLQGFQYEKQNYQNIQNDLILFQLRLIECPSNSTSDCIVGKIETIIKILNEKLPIINNNYGLKKNILVKNNTCPIPLKKEAVITQIQTEIIPTELDEKISQFRAKLHEFNGDETNLNFKDFKSQLEELKKNSDLTNLQLLQIDAILREFDQKIEAFLAKNFERKIQTKKLNITTKINENIDGQNQISVNVLKQIFDIANENPPKRNFNIVVKSYDPFAKKDEKQEMKVQETNQDDLPSVFKIAQKFDDLDVREYNSTVREIKRLTPFIGEDCLDGKNQMPLEEITLKEDTNENNKDENSTNEEKIVDLEEIDNTHSEETVLKEDVNSNNEETLVDLEEKITVSNEENHENEAPKPKSDQEKKEKSKVKKVLHEIKKELNKITSNINITEYEDSLAKLNSIQHILEATSIKIKFKNQVREKNVLLKQVEETKKTLTRNHNVTDEDHKRYTIRKALLEIQQELEEIVFSDEKNRKINLEILEKKLISLYVNPEYDRLLKEKHRLAMIINEHKNKTTIVNVENHKPLCHVINQLMEYKQEFNKISSKLTKKNVDDYEIFMQITFLKKLADNLNKMDINPAFEKEINEAKNLQKQIQNVINVQENNTIENNDDKKQQEQEQEDVYEDILPPSFVILPTDDKDLSIILEEESDSQEDEVKENQKEHLKRVNILLGVDDEFEEENGSLDWIDNDSLNGDADEKVILKECEGSNV